MCTLTSTSSSSAICLSRNLTELVRLPTTEAMLTPCSTITWRSTETRPAVEAGEKLRKLMEEISAIYKKAGYTPPATDDVIAQSGSKQASQVLEAMGASGALVRLDAQINMDAGLYGEAKEKALSIIDQKGQVTLGEFRDALGTSRKYAVALLESFDKARITKMKGEGRIRA